MALSFTTRAKQWSRGWHANIGIATALTLGFIALSCPFIAHKGLDFTINDVAIGKTLMQIHYGKFLPKEWQWVWIDLQGAALFFLIVSGWLIHHRAVKKAAVRAADDPSAPGSSVTIVWEGGRPEAEATARAVAKAAEERGLRAFATDSRRYQAARLVQERWLVFVLAEKDAELPLRLNGEKLPRLEFAVLAVGDTTVARCEDLGAGLAERGAKSFIPAGRSAEATGDIVAHLVRFVKVPAAPKSAARQPQPAGAR